MNSTGILTSPHSKSGGPVISDGGTREVKTRFSGPHSSPGKHGHASMLDFGFLQELGIGEHVGEGTLDFVHLSKSHGVEDLSGHLRVECNLVESGGGLGDRGGCEGGSAGNERTDKSELPVEMGRKRKCQITKDDVMGR